LRVRRAFRYVASQALYFAADELRFVRAPPRSVAGSVSATRRLAPAALPCSKDDDQSFINARDLLLLRGMKRALGRTPLDHRVSALEHGLTLRSRALMCLSQGHGRIAT
jgi:hypothetical protein